MKRDSLKIYRTIEDLPAWNFFKAKEGDEDDLRYLFILESYHDLNNIKHSHAFELLVTWSNIHDQIINLNGITDKQVQIILLKRQIIWLEVELLLEPEKRILKTFIKNKQSQLKALTGEDEQEDEISQKNITFEEQIVTLERWLKMPIDSKKISLAKFLTYKKQYNNEARKITLKQLANNG